MAEPVLHPAIAAIAAAALGRPAPPPHAPVDRTAQALTLAAIVDRQGPEGLLAAGRHLDAAMTEPIVLVLANSEHPRVLFDKIDRLNRHLHSTHRQRVIELDHRGALLEHHATGGGDPPSPFESLFVCGLHLALLGRIGARGIGCGFPASTSGGADVFHDGRPRDVPTDGVAHWRITWDDVDPVRPLPGLDEVLLRDLPPDLTDRPLSVAVEAVVGADLARPWRLGEAAAELSVSRRTLQRRLADEGTTFTDLVRRLRIDAAQRLLADPSRSVTDIGFVLGFADTAHFSRAFAAATGTPPSRWRAERR